MKRRSFLRHLAAGTAAVSTAGALGALAFRPSRAMAAPPPGRKFLFVLTASGGGSIVDSLLPVLSSEVSSPSRAASLITYPDAAIAQPTGSAIRCVRNLRLDGLFSNAYDPADFLAAHRDDLRDGQVVLRPGLSQVGRSQVGHDANRRHPVALVGDARSDPFAGLLHCGIGQSDDGERRQSRAEVDLDLHGRGVQAHDGW